MIFFIKEPCWFDIKAKTIICWNEIHFQHDAIFDANSSVGFSDFLYAQHSSECCRTSQHFDITTNENDEIRFHYNVFGSKTVANAQPPASCVQNFTDMNAVLFEQRLYRHHHHSPPSKTAATLTNICKRWKRTKNCEILFWKSARKKEQHEWFSP